MFLAIIVLPRPPGATRTMLRALSRKSSDAMDSTRGRSMAVGQRQSKSARGLNFSSRERERRRSKPRRARSFSSRSATWSRTSVAPHRFLVARATRSSIAALAAKIPRARRRARRSLTGSLLLVVARAGESVVGAEGPKVDSQIPHARVIRENDRQGHGDLSRAATLVEDMRDRLSGEGAAAMSFGECELQLGGSVRVEQTKQSTRGATQMAAVHGDVFEKGLRVGARGHQPVSAAVFPGVALVVGQAVEMACVLDLSTVLP